MPQRVHIIGGKNSGKTTLVTELVSHLTQQGHRVGTIKHTHHHHELDAPGKDSHRHREAGAAVVGILARRMNAVFWPAIDTDDKADRYAAIMKTFDHCDVVLVEGDLHADAPKIEVWHAETETEPLSAADNSITALVTHDNCDVSVPIYKRSSLTEIAALVLELAAK